jgi:fatty acid desaturase 2 (delta-6 desaturase)
MWEHFSIFFQYIAIISAFTIYSVAKREPTTIDKRVIAFYNISNSLINLYVVIGLSPYVLNDSWGFHVPGDEQFKHYIWMHFLCKYIDFTDTIIMILKQNWNQVHFLQLFHHSTIGVVWHWLYYTAPLTTATWGFGALANSFIHFLMYLHYFVTSFGIKNPFKSIMTSLQMIQFAICLVHSAIVIMYVSELHTSAFVQTFYMSSMLALFYVYVYLKPKEKQVKPKDRKQLIIKINGTEYDATEFSKKHPGGNIIEQYDVSKVPDATDAFNTFHLHSVHSSKMLKSLPVIRRDEKQTTTEFQELTRKWKLNGLYEPQIAQFLLWAFGVFGITLSGFLLLKRGYPIVGGIVAGIGWANCGFVQHHAGHLAFTGKPQIDWLMQSFFECVMKGGSARWWRNRHNKHHAMPNSIEHDGDLRTTPFFAWDDILVKKIPTFLLRIQHILFIPFLSIYVPIFFFTTKAFVIRRKYWDEAGLIFIHFLLSSYFVNDFKEYLLFYFIGAAIQGIYLGVMFGLSHYTLPRVNDDSTDWVEWQLVSTCNWGVDSAFARYVSGFLNLQIEHHIAPQMPAENYSLITNDIRKYAAKNNLPYMEFTFANALYNLLNGLKITADKELARRKKRE